MGVKAVIIVDKMKKILFTATRAGDKEEANEIESKYLQLPMLRTIEFVPIVLKDNSVLKHMFQVFILCGSFLRHLESTNRIGFICHI